MKAGSWQLHIELEQTFGYTWFPSQCEEFWVVLSGFLEWPRVSEETYKCDVG